MPSLAWSGHGTLNWSGLFAPAGTPPEVVAKLHKAFTDAVKSPFVLERRQVRDLRVSHRNPEGDGRLREVGAREVAEDLE
jgi:tripartite-type tricarboxylate transporter receptor subunit TctC